MNRGSQISSLYVLDGDLDTVGSLEDVAPDEEIKSARFVGSQGYFVTFRQTDPLFCVDLSRPEDPRIVGEVKVSGFSSYLHLYGDGLLLALAVRLTRTPDGRREPRFPCLISVSRDR